MMRNVQDYAAIILAAGKSSRLRKNGIETPKPLLTIDGITFLAAAIRNCDGICAPLVVLGHRADLMAVECESLGVRYCKNANYEKGQTSSLKEGIRNLPDPIKAFFLYPVDYPRVRKTTLERLIQTFESSPKSFVLPVYQGRGGHPLLISTDRKEAFLSLGDDEPANMVVRAHQDSVLRLQVDDPGILADVDTREDLEKTL